MNAGAELNAKIAVEIFGWRPSQNKRGYWQVDLPGDLCYSSFYDPREFKYDPDTGKENTPRSWWETSIGEHLPRFSNDIAAAWQIVDKLDPVLHLELKRYAVGWLAVFSARDNSQVQQAAETPALAICLAARAAITRNPALKIPTAESNA